MPTAPALPPRAILAVAGISWIPRARKYGDEAAGVPAPPPSLPSGRWQPIPFSLTTPPRTALSTEGRPRAAECWPVPLPACVQGEKRGEPMPPACSLKLESN